MLQSPLFTLAFWLLLFPSLWASGSLPGFREKNPLLAGILKLALGLGIFAHFLILVAAFGAFKSYSVLIFLAFFLILSWRKGREVFDWLKDGLKSFWSDSSLFSRVCQFIFLITLFFTALFCFLPEISNDALGIQLYLAKLFVTKNSLTPAFFFILSYRPLLMSVLYATGLFFKNVAIAKLFHWFCGILLISATAIKIEKATQNKKITLFLSLMLWLTPTLMNQITTTYIDAGVSLFIFLGYCVFIEALEDLKPVQFFYAGMLIGLAVAMRTLSLNAYFALMVLLTFRFFRPGIKSRVGFVAFCFSLGVILTSAYWFLRAWIYTGNPVYPYLGSLFGNHDFTFLDSLYFHEMGLPKSVSSFLMIPWNITTKPQYFDYHHWIGPFYLSALPFFLYAAVMNKKARIHAYFVLFSIVFWYFTGQLVRYLLPTMPVYLIATAMGMNDLSKKFLQSRSWHIFNKTAASTAIASLLLLTAYHFRFQFMPIFRAWSVQEYLHKMERSIPIAEWINKNLPETAKILVVNEPHAFYFDKVVIQDIDFSIKTHYKNQNSPSAIVSLLNEKGITHILDAEEIYNPEGLNEFKNPSRPIDLILHNRQFTKVIFTISSSNVLDRRQRYVLYKLLSLPKP